MSSFRNRGGRTFRAEFISLVAVATGGLALSATAADPGLSELSLEELMSVRLNEMSISEIHHTHDKGEVMLGYMFMHMNMDGNLDGTSSMSTAEIFADGYMVAPLSMEMQMHMLHLMYAPTDLVTLLLMMPYVIKSMDHRVDPGIPMPFAGEKFTTRSEGPGDLVVTSLWELYENEGHQFLAEFGWSFPTGSIDENGVIPMSMGAKVRLPYPMQLGSGTYDFHPGLTYIGQSSKWYWGVNARGIVRIGENANDYTLGDEWSTTGWGARRLTEWLSASLRLDARGWGNINGADPALNPAAVPTADPDLRAGERIDLLFGVNMFTGRGRLAGNRLALEGGLPIYQRLDGPQLETRWRIQLAWDWTFSTNFSWD